VNLAHVAEGFWNLIFKNEGIEGVAKKRLEICAKCPALVMSKSLGMRCTPKVSLKHVDTGVMVKGCGCVLKAKTRVKEERCPAGKWKEVLA
jgi:hypothetical protein